MSRYNITHFPGSEPQVDRRPATYEAVPPVSRTLMLMLDYARSVRRQRDMIDRIESLKVLARIPIPIISPVGTEALRQVRGSLIDELVHDLVPQADVQVSDLLCALALWLREEGSAT